MIRRVNSFKIVTFWSELVNKRVQKIEAELSEIRFINQSGLLFAIGFIQRKIKYLDIDGRWRRAEDKVQFEINLGEAIPEPLPLLRPKLTEDYFIFQPDQVGEEQAILEQGFTITVGEDHIDRPKIRSLLLELIKDSGKESAILTFPIEFPKDCIQPRNLSGKVCFNQVNQASLFSGEITGVVTYRSRGNQLYEMDWRQPFTLLTSVPALKNNQSIRVSGEIAETMWRIGPMDNRWLLQLKLDFHWSITEPKEVMCQEPVVADASIHKIKTLSLLAQWWIETPKTFSMAEFETINHFTEVSLDNVKSSARLFKKGLLLTAEITFGAVFINEQELECYREFQVKFEELTDFQWNSETIDDPEIVVDLQAKLVEFHKAGGELKLEIDCSFHIKAFQNEIVCISDNNNPINDLELISTKSLMSTKSFSWLGEENFSLPSHPSQVELVRAKLERVDSIVKNGWIIINGQLEVEVTYFNQEHVLCESIFQSAFQETYLWPELTEFIEVVLKSQLDYHSYLLTNSELTFQYLVHFGAEAYLQRELKITTVKEEYQCRPMANAKTSPLKFQGPSAITKMLIEKMIPLQKWGMVQEIAQSQLDLSMFSFRQSFNAILVEGNLSGKIEYWDNNRYLQQETIEFPFWKFIYSEHDQLSVKISPQIINYSYSPVKTRPWQKGSVKLSLELELNQILSEGEETESVTTKSCKLFNNSGRG